MKKMFSVILSVIILMAFAGLSIAENNTSAATTQTPENPVLMGKITAVDTTAMTVTVTGMSGPQGGNGKPDGSAPGDQGQPPQNGNGQQSGNAPQGGNAGSADASTQATPDANGQNEQRKGPQNGNGQQNGNAPDANGQMNPADQQTITFTVTSNTTITSADNTAIELANLTVDTMVSVMYSGDETNGYTALSIQTMPTPANTTAADATATATPAAN